MANKTAWAYAKVINEQIPVSNKNLNSWSNLSKSVSLDNKTEPKGGGYSTFGVTTKKVKTKVKGKTKTTTKTTISKPYYLTAHDYGLNIPSNAYIKSVKFTACMKATKGTKTVVPRGRIEVNGQYHEVKESGSGKTGWHNGDYVVYQTGNFTTKYKEYSYTLDETNWKKGKFKVSNLNTEYLGLDLIFNDPTKAGTVTIKWVKVLVTYVVPEYVIDYSIKTTETSPYLIGTGKQFDLTITCTQITEATDNIQRKVLVDVPFATIIQSIQPTNSTYEFNENEKIEWAVTGKPKGVSKLKLTLVGHRRELHEIVSSNDYIGSKSFYYYNLPAETDNEFYDIKLSTDPLRYGVRACIYLKAHLIDVDGVAEFRLFETHNGNKTYVTPWSAQLINSDVEAMATVTGADKIRLTVPEDTECTVEVKVCYKSPLQAGDGFIGVTDDYDDDYSIPVHIEKPYIYVVSNDVINDNDTFTFDVSQDYIRFINHRFPTVSELNAVVLPLGFSMYDNDMIMSDSSLQMHSYEAVDYIGVVPLEFSHYDPKNSTHNDLLDEQYKNKVYMGKKGVIKESIDLNIKVRPHQATTLQGLVKLDKPTPINANHKIWEGDTLNHRGWAEMTGIEIEKTNPLYYDVSLDVTYITHDINTKFTVARGNRIIDMDIPSVLTETVATTENISNSENFTVTTDGTFAYEEEAEDELCNLFTLQNGQSFNIKSIDKLSQETQIRFSWLSNKLVEDKENKIYREIRLFDNLGNSVASLVYYDFDLSDEDFISCQVLLSYINEVGGVSEQTEQITLRTDIDIEEIDDEDSEDTISIEDMLDDDISVDDLFGSTVTFAVNNGVLKVIDEGFNGREFVSDDIKLDTNELYYEITFNNLNDEADDTEVMCFTSLNVMETVLETKYSEQYGNIVVAPFPVTDTAKKLIFTREGEEGTIFYYKDDGGNFKYLLEPYYQYNNGVDLRTSDGISVFDLDNSYSTYEIQNGLIGLGFNKYNGNVWLSKYDLQSKEYEVTHYFNCGEDVKFSMPPVSDDRIDLMVNDAVFTVFRGRPYVLVKHQNMDIKVLSSFNQVWAEKVGNQDNDYPVIYDLLNSDNQLPSKVGGNNSISAGELEIVEVDNDDTLTTSVSLSAPSEVERGVETDYPITTSVESTSIWEYIDLGEYEGVFGTYSSNVQVNNDEPYSIFLSKFNPIWKQNVNESIDATVNSFDGNPIANKMVYFTMDYPNSDLDIEVTGLPYAILNSETATATVNVRHKKELLDSYSYDPSITPEQVYNIGLDDIGVDLSDKDFVLEYDFTPQTNGSVIVIGAKSEYTTTPAKSNYRVGIGIWSDGKIYYTNRTNQSYNYPTTTDWTLNTTKHCRIEKTGNTVNYYCDGVLIGTLTVSWWSNYTEYAIYGYSWRANTNTVENVVLKYSDSDLGDIMINLIQEEE